MALSFHNAAGKAINPGDFLVPLTFSLLGISYC